MSSLASAAAYVFPTAILATVAGVLTASRIHIHAVENGNKRLHSIGTFAGVVIAFAVVMLSTMVAPHTPLATATMMLSMAAWVLSWGLLAIGPGTASYDNARAAYELAQESDDDWTTIYPVDEEAVGDE